MAEDGRSGILSSDYLRRHLPIYALTMIVFLMGVIFGALSVRVLPESARTDLAQDLAGFFRDFSDAEQTSVAAASRKALYDNTKTVLIAWVLGISVIGSPGILVLLFLRGFVVGFSAGFLVHDMAAKGIVLAAVSILPQNIFIVPAMLAACEGSLAFAVALIEDRVSRRRALLYPKFLLTCVTTVGAVGLLVLASAVESFITPVFIELASRYLL